MTIKNQNFYMQASKSINWYKFEEKIVVYFVILVIHIE